MVAGTQLVYKQKGTRFSFRCCPWQPKEQKKEEYTLFWHSIAAVLSKSGSNADILYVSLVPCPVTMAKDPLAEAGLYFDEVSGLQILDPDVRQKSLELKEECKVFIEDFGEFQKITGQQIQMLDEIAKDVEREKKKAIGAKFLLNSMRRQREAKTQQLQALIAEKKMELERLCTEYEALHKIEMEGNDFINQFMQK